MNPCGWVDAEVPPSAPDVGLAGGCDCTGADVGGGAEGVVALVEVL